MKPDVIIFDESTAMLDPIGRKDIIDTILKFKTAFDKMNSKDDPRSKLLLALKQYLKESRKEKLDQYIQNRKTVSIISGGNIDLSRVSQITGFVDA